ncbi:MAG TPA: hypothetical protein VJB66_04225 [Candidatus Nanoarchaeia archaeon]|nr:hypothetical protein [Candidatus Nanoarchaeia archaeon]
MELGEVSQGTTYSSHDIHSSTFIPLNVPVSDNLYLSDLYRLDDRTLSSLCSQHPALSSELIFSIHRRHVDNLLPAEQSHIPPFTLHLVKTLAENATIESILSLIDHYVVRSPHQ